MTERDARPQERARTLVQVLEPHLDARRRHALLEWARELQTLSRADSTKLEKARQVLVATAGSARETRLLPLVWESAKDLAWEDRSWAARLGLSGAVAATVASSQGAGIAAFGTAIGVPLWVVFGAGGTFVGTLVDELTRLRPRERAGNTRA